MRISDWSSDVCSSDLFAHHIAIADFKPRGFALIFFILRHAADGAEPVEGVVGAYAGVAVDDAMRTDHRTLADDDVFTDDAIGPYADVIGNLGTSGDDGGRMYRTGHC